jgi:hypothetical protein
MDSNNITKQKAFLKLFGNNKIICYSHESTKNGGMIQCDLKTISKHNKNSDIYFYVNSGGTKANEINNLTSLYVDLDAGRDKNGKYFKPSIVITKKKAMYNKIKTFPVQPNVVVDTRNGLHLYWLLKPTTNKNLWKTLQSKIFNYFKSVGADSKAQKINQLLRVPYTYWRKKWENKKDDYLITYTIASKSHYDITFLNDKLDKLSSASSYSYNRTSKFVETSKSNINNTLTVVDEVILFLREISKQLYYKRMDFSSHMANQLADKLEKLY